MLPFQLSHVSVSNGFIPKSALILIREGVMPRLQLVWAVNARVISAVEQYNALDTHMKR